MNTSEHIILFCAGDALIGTAAATSSVYLSSNYFEEKIYLTIPRVISMHAKAGTSSGGGIPSHVNASTNIVYPIESSDSYTFSEIAAELSAMNGTKT